MKFSTAVTSKIFQESANEVARIIGNGKSGDFVKIEVIEGSKGLILQSSVDGMNTDRTLLFEGLPDHHVSCFVKELEAAMEEMTFKCEGIVERNLMHLKQVAAEGTLHRGEDTDEDDCPSPYASSLVAESPDLKAKLRPLLESPADSSPEGTHVIPSTGKAKKEPEEGSDGGNMNDTSTEVDSPAPAPIRRMTRGRQKKLVTHQVDNSGDEGSLDDMECYNNLSQQVGLPKAKY